MKLNWRCAQDRHCTLNGICKLQRDKPILNVWITWQKQCNHYSTEEEKVVGVEVYTDIFEME